MNFTANVGDTLQDRSNIVIQSGQFNEHRADQHCIPVSYNRQQNAQLLVTRSVTNGKYTTEAAITNAMNNNDYLSKCALTSESYGNTMYYEGNNNSNKDSSSIQNIESKDFDAQYVSSSKYTLKKSPDTSNHNVTHTNVHNSSHRPVPPYPSHTHAYPVSIGNEKKFAEKTTFCRPVTNYYNQQFIYKTMQRNERLQKLMKKLVLVRQREKQKESWNNYINDLKNKHGYCSNRPNSIPAQYGHGGRDSEIIDDCYNTRFTWKQSNPCRNLLLDFYGNSIQPDSLCEEFQGAPSRDQRSYIYDNDSFCFPTSSQARSMMRSRDGRSDSYRSQKPRQLTPGRFFGPSIVVDRDYRQRSKYTREDARYSLIRNSSIQTDLNVLPLLVDAPRTNNVEENDANNKQETIKEQYNRVLDNIDKLKKEKHNCQCESEDNPLANIETKLDTLIKSINEFIIEVKSRKSLIDSKNSAAVSCKLSGEISKNSNNSTNNNNNNLNNKLNLTKSDTFGRSKAGEVVCNVVDSTSKSMLGMVTNRLKRMESGTSKLNKILNEELSKSNKVKRDIENILNSKMERPCAVQITFDIPTRDRATEVTASLSKAKLDSQLVIEEIDTGHSIDDNTKDNPRPTDDKNMTIAVNTDPLGLLALLRISRETIKQLLSCMPHIDYTSYLPLLSPQRQISTVSHYICHICGAAFGRPSQLSDHIQEHNLGQSRDCCVCRHVVDTQRNRYGLFACQYCGQRFTRAYCCELHQQTCARRLGRRHDVTSSLMLLR